MGTEFAIVFDIAIVAIIVCMFFSGYRRGFAKIILGMAAAVIAFVIAVLFSSPIASGIYTGFVEKPVTEAMENAVNSTFSGIKLDGFIGLDYDKVKISNRPVTEIEINFEGSSNITFDLTNLDLSETGLNADDAKRLGAETNLDLSSVNARSANFSRSELEKHGLGKLAVAQFAALCLINSNSFENFNGLFSSAHKFLPSGMNYASSDNIAVSAVRGITVSMLETGDTLKDSLMNSIVRPNCLIIIRTIVFALIFAIVCAVVGIIANASKLLDKIPVVGKANSILGGIAGACQGLVAVFIVCLATRLAVSLCGGNALIFNESVMESTILFKFFYKAEFLNFFI